MSWHITDQGSPGHSTCPGVSWSKSVPFVWWSGHAKTCGVHPGMSWPPCLLHRSWPWNTRLNQMAEVPGPWQACQDKAQFLPCILLVHRILLVNYPYCFHFCFICHSIYYCCRFAASNTFKDIITWACMIYRTILQTCICSPKPNLFFPSPLLLLVSNPISLPFFVIVGALFHCFHHPSNKSLPMHTRPFFFVCFL